MNRLKFIFLLIPIGGFGQNLIPNPGFEEVFTELEFQWVQPQGPYYHYESTDSLTQHQARSGRYVNGLCMYNNRENEYLHVKLLEPLEEGKTYELSFYARLMRAKCFNHSLQSLIGIHFGHERLDTQIPGDLYLRPQLNCSLPDSNRFEWFRLNAEYKSNGGERYLTLGYFAATQSEELRRADSDRFNPKPESKSVQDEDKSWLYLPPDEQKKYIKKEKKRARKEKKASNDFAKPKAELVVYPETGSNPEVMFFQVRYYFDDFCLREVSDSIKGDCAPTSVVEKLEKGNTITLKNVFFETDKALLREESVVQLAALEKILIDYPKMTIELRGYTDNRGDSDYNLSLSEDRAHSVRNWLMDRGIEQSRIQAVGLGESNPVADNDSEAGRTLNRRVEFLIVDM